MHSQKTISKLEMIIPTTVNNMEDNKIYEDEIYRLNVALSKYKRKEYNMKREVCKQILGVIENVPNITVDIIKQMLEYEIEREDQ